MIPLSQAYDLEIILTGSEGKEVMKDWYKELNCAERGSAVAAV